MAAIPPAPPVLALSPKIPDHEVASRLAQSLRRRTGQFLCGFPSTRPPASAITLGNAKFLSLPEAAALVEDLDVVGFAGVGGHAPSTGFVRALAERFEASEALMTPKQLTLLAPGGETTLDPLLEAPGLVAKLFTSHLGAHPAAAARMVAPPTGNVAALEVHVLPRGAFSLCVARMATDGANSYACAAGVGTAVYDPRCGGGTALTAGVKDEYVRCEEDGSLRYFAPLPTVAVVNAAAADAKGNVYARGASAPADAAELAAAAALNGGRVVAVVAFVVPEGYGPILVPAARVSAVVVDRTLEQSFGALHVAPWPFLVAPDADADAAAASDRVDAAAAAAARALGGRRPAGAADALVGAAVAKLTALCARRGGRVFVGAQLGAAGAALAPLTRSGDLELLSDGGAIGGAYSAAFAGGALDPKEVGSSAEVYRRIYDRLDVAVVRVARVDASGDAAADGGAAAARGGGAPYASSGVAEAAELASIVLLVCDFEEAATVRRDKTSGALAVRRRGAPNFVASLADAGDLVAFSGARALRNGKQVFFVTSVGIIALVQDGFSFGAAPALLLLAVYPGIDPKKDVVDATAAKIHMPRGDAANVEVLGWPLTDTANPLLFHSQLKVDLGTAVSSAGRLPPLTPVRAVPVA